MTPLPDTHAEAWNLLPWLANGRLAAGDREWIEAHVQSCERCRHELAEQRLLATRLRAQGEEPVPSTRVEEQRSFDRLWSRIEASDAAGALPASAATPATPVAPAADGAASRGSQRMIRWLAAAVIIQGMGLALFGLYALRSPDRAAPAEFRTVTRLDAPATQAPRVTLVFAPEASMAQVNALLAAQGLRLVSGPGLSGNYLAELSADAVASGASPLSVAEALSRDPHVAFAQPAAP